MGGGGAGLADRLGGKAGHVRLKFARSTQFFKGGSAPQTYGSASRLNCFLAGQVFLPHLQATSARFEEHGAAS